MKGWRFLLAGSLLFIATATLTPGSPFSAGALRPDFWCFACGAEGGADFTLNVALFIPFGVALALAGISPVRALFIGALLSAAVEGAQELGWASDRVASATDVFTNTCGTFIGALVAWHRGVWLNPSPRAARVLTAVGACTVFAFLSFTAWALGPDVPRGTMSENMTGFQISPYPFTPGYGWYHGRVDYAIVNDRPYTHTGDGPVILRGVARNNIHGAVRLSGRDERREFLPLLYVHDLRVSNPLLMIGQQGDAARLQVRLRGERLRFPGPSIRLANAFDEATAGNQTLTFSVTPAVWTLSSEATGATRRAMLPLSLSLGWTLLQTVVHVGDRGAWLVSLLWLFVMWLPLGYWLLLSGRAGVAAPVIAGLVALALTLWLVPAAATIARCSFTEWASAISGMASGVLFAMRHRAKQS